MTIKLTKEQAQLLDYVLDDYIQKAGKGDYNALEFDSMEELDALDDIRTILNENKG